YTAASASSSNSRRLYVTTTAITTGELAAPPPSAPGTSGTFRWLGTARCPAAFERPPGQDPQPPDGRETAAEIAHRPLEPWRGGDGRLDPAGQSSLLGRVPLRPGRRVRLVVLVHHERRRGGHRGVEHPLGRLVRRTGGGRPGRPRPQLVQIADEIVRGTAQRGYQVLRLPLGPAIPAGGKLEGPVARARGQRLGGERFPDRSHVEPGPDP